MRSLRCRIVPIEGVHGTGQMTERGSRATGRVILDHGARKHVNRYCGAMTRSNRRTGVPTTIGDNLRQARQRLIPAMTIARLASRAGCSAALVSRIEAGQVVPSVGTLVALATALGVSVSDALDVDSPSRRAAEVIATARTHLLLGRVPDLTDVGRAGEDSRVPPEWRARAAALVALATPNVQSATAFARHAEDCLGLVAVPEFQCVVDLARMEVALAVGEVAWARGDAPTASRRWGNGLAVVAAAADVEAAWARASLARALARVAPGTRTAANALLVAIEALVPITDPGAVASRLIAQSVIGPLLPASLALAIVGAAQVAIADARARRAALTDGSIAQSAPPRSGVPLGRHLR